MCIRDRTNSAGDPIGELTLRPDGTYTFNPAPNYYGDVPPVTYTVVDPSGATDIGTLDIGPVIAVNDAPTVVPGNEVTDQTINDSDTILIDTSVSFDDVESDTLTFTATGLPPGLTIDPVTGIISGTIDSSASQNGPNNNGTYPVTVSVDDGNGGTADMMFTYTVDNPAPIAQDDDVLTLSLIHISEPTRPY